jgi:hypothetical protein
VFATLTRPQSLARTNFKVLKTRLYRYADFLRFFSAWPVAAFVGSVGGCNHLPVLVSHPPTLLLPRARVAMAGPRARVAMDGGPTWARVAMAGRPTSVCDATSGRPTSARGTMAELATCCHGQTTDLGGGGRCARHPGGHGHWVSTSLVGTCTERAGCRRAGPPDAKPICSTHPPSTAFARGRRRLRRCFRSAAVAAAADGRRAIVASPWLEGGARPVSTKCLMKCL